MRYSRNQKYRVPERLVRYLNGFPDPEEVERVVRCLRVLQLRGDDRVTFLGEEDPAEEVFFRDTAVDLIKQGHAEHFIDSVVVVQEPLDSEEVEGLRRQILARYAETVFNPGPIRDPPVRGPFGEATIELKAGVTPVKQRMFQIQGSRREAWESLIDRFEAEGKIEPGVSAWSSPSFPVPKKNSGNVSSRGRLSRAQRRDGDRRASTAANRGHPREPG